jgi:murein DD-endopeptidase MepM/ murein hydrolase activator NlpD
MKKKSTILGLMLLCILSNFTYAQQPIINSNGINPINENNEKNPCITIQEYAILDKQCSENSKRLGLKQNKFNGTLTTSLIWPIKAAADFSDSGYHFIGAYVDQNTTSGAILDYNCETNTYDAHQGTDIAIWPFGFFKMENNQVEVIAAAAGTIVQKADGNFDRNCATNSLTANSIIIQHADGSQALYWHMKKNSVTSKIVGQTVVAGEYLGIVGSSGSSTGPHLHFEIRSGSTSATYKDPFSGTCNSLNTNSWWAVQKPHTDPAILKVSVNTTDIVIPGCPTTEISNESNSFSVPFQGAGLSPGYAKFYIFLREIPANSLIDMKILNPNGSTFNSWTYTIQAFYKVSYWGFSKLLPTIPGNYTFEASYNGIKITKSFDITLALGLPTLVEKEKFQIFPNPTNANFSLIENNIDNGNYTFTLSNSSGQILKTEYAKIEKNTLNKDFSISALSKGIYFLSIYSENYRVIKKLIKN